VCWTKFLSFLVLKGVLSQVKTQVSNNSCFTAATHQLDRQRLLWNENGYDMGISSKVVMVVPRQLHALIYCCYSYETARKIKQQQDDYCDSALSGDWNGLGAFPDDLQWEALVDVLRGRVKVR